MAALDLEKLMERLRRAATAVEYEYAENDRRLTWFLVFQAFLFQAYATALQALATANPAQVNDIAYVRLFVWLVCIVGVVTAGFTGVSTGAGIAAILTLKRTREEKVEKEAQPLGFEPMGFGVKNALHWLGLLPTVAFPWMLLSAWWWLVVRALRSGTAVLP